MFRQRMPWRSLGIVAGLLILALTGCEAPQMGADEDVFNTVDALYTAVRSEDEKQLDACDTRLKAYRAAGKLPAKAADALDDVIATARKGRWQSAARTLYHFMKDQRREGERSHKHRSKTRKRDKHVQGGQK